jgi:nucleoside-diphosphate-sugar epimerase
MWRLLQKISAPEMLFVLDPASSAHKAYSSIQPKSQIFNIGHDYALRVKIFIVMMKKPENLDFETWPHDPRP